MVKFSDKRISKVNKATRFPKYFVENNMRMKTSLVYKGKKIIKT